MFRFGSGKNYGVAWTLMAGVATAVAVALHRRILGLARPRLWYVLTLLKLKAALRESTGNGKLDGERLMTVAELPHPHIDRQANVLCQYAIKQLVGINGMWWILYAFAPFYMDEKNLMAASFQLRALIARYVIEPGALKYGDSLAKTDAFALVRELRLASKSFVTCNEYALPRVKLCIGNKNPKDNDGVEVATESESNKGESTIPVTFLPMDVAINCDEPPLYGNKELVIKDVGPDEIDCEPIPIFVSHQWGSRDNPNHNNEFNKLLMLVSFTIQASIQACIMLLRNGFPLEQLVVCQGKWMRDAYRLHSMYIYDEEKLDPEFLNESGVPCKLPQVSGALAKDIFKAVAKVVLRNWDGKPVTEVKHVWHLAFMQQVWFWYDYSSLPQWQTREKYPELKQDFYDTLDHLPELQRRCHSLAMNTSERYPGRAWCVSEFIGMDSNLFGGRTEYGHPLTVYERTSSIDQVPFRAFELLVNPTVPLEQVLGGVGLAFTNDKHNETNVRPICWILWNSILRRKMFFYDYFYSFEEAQSKLLVGIGRPSQLEKWLKYTSLALVEVFENDASHRKPFLEAIQAYDDILDYDIDEWANARKAACDISPDGHYQELVVPCIDKEDDDDPNAILDSIKVALASVKKIALESTEEAYYQVFVEQQGKKKKAHPHFALLFYDLERY